jgi:hypothetical protein
MIQESLVINAVEKQEVRIAPVKNVTPTGKL